MLGYVSHLVIQFKEYDYSVYLGAVNFAASIYSPPLPPLSFYCCWQNTLFSRLEQQNQRTWNECEIKSEYDEAGKRL